MFYQQQKNRVLAAMMLHCSSKQTQYREASE